MQLSIVLPRLGTHSTSEIADLMVYDLAFQLFRTDAATAWGVRRGFLPTAGVPQNISLGRDTYEIPLSVIEIFGANLG